MIPTRSESRALPLYGVFPGALVQRSFDWAWEDQDGGRGRQGRVVALEGWEKETDRSVVRVAWDRWRGTAAEGTANQYRLGHKVRASHQLVICIPSRFVLCLFHQVFLPTLEERL